MAVSPAEILESAETSGNGSSEVDWRNATSRAYYAAFHRVKPIAERVLNFSSDRGSVHHELVQALQHERNSSLRQLAYMPDECRKYRARADYDIDDDFPFTVCKTVLELSKRVITKSDAIEGGL